MPTLDQIHESLRGLEGASPFAFLLAALAGLLLSATPSVLALVPAVMGYVAGEPEITRRTAVARSFAFVVGTATTFGAYGLVFGFAGSQIAPLFGENGFLVSGVVLVALGLMMLGKLRLRAPVPDAPRRRITSVSGAYFLGIPFGLVGSACPCSIPVVLALLLYAASIGSAWFGAALLFVFALVRGLPLLFAGSFAGLLKELTVIARFQTQLEKGSGVLLVMLGVAFIATRFI